MRLLDASHRGVRRVIVASAFALPVAACDDSLLDVDDPDIIDPGNLVSVQGAEALFNGAIAEFALAKDGGATGDLGIVEAGGWFTDEFAFGGTPPQAREMDLRAVAEDNSAWNTTYRNLHRAREAAENGARVFEHVLSDDARLGELYAISAAIHIFLGEHYCSGMPFSTTEPEIQFGQPLSTQEVFEAALQKLEQAESGAAGDGRILNLVRVLRGRALLDLGRFTEAADAVTAVATDYEYLVFHSTATDRQVNMLYVENWETDRYAVSDREGGNGLPFGSENDPRAPTRNDGVSSFDGETPMYRLLTLESRSTPTVLAGGLEARLIEAEAALQSNDVDTFLTALDAVRGVFGLAAVTDPGSASARGDLLFRERAFTLFNSGHRLGDLRRLVTQYGRDWRTVYPIGNYHKDGLQRGDQLSIIIPQIERNNPNYEGCDATQA